ncbi:MAG: hypothetical protein M3176_19900, partial [Chloroflexota bacterium]|nr:hypothetical protein [Chloroflexota bacterium]
TPTARARNFGGSIGGATTRQYADASLIVSLLTGDMPGRMADREWPPRCQRAPFGQGDAGEDRSLIHKGNGPSIMVILRDTVIGVLHRAGWRTIAERLRYYSGNARDALALLGIPLTENA